MKNKLFFLLAMPLVWLVVVIITHNSCADKVWLLSIAPSAWLFFFSKFDNVETPQFVFGGLAAMFIVGFVLYKLKMKPRTAIISSLITTFILWIALCIFLSKGRPIKVPGAVFTWFLCCFNFSLCFLPFFALTIKLVSSIRRKVGSCKNL